MTYNRFFIVEHYDLLDALNSLSASELVDYLHNLRVIVGINKPKNKAGQPLISDADLLRATLTQHETALNLLDKPTTKKEARDGHTTDTLTSKKATDNQRLSTPNPVPAKQQPLEQTRVPKRGPPRGAGNDSPLRLRRGSGDKQIQLCLTQRQRYNTLWL